MTASLKNPFRLADAADGADRLAAQLAGTGIVAVSIDPSGVATCLDPAAARFFTHYAIPALQAIGLPAGAAAETRIPGVLARLWPSSIRRRNDTSPTIVLIARTASIDPRSEDAQQWCTRLKLDTAWLAEEAGRILPVSADTLSRLAELTTVAATAEQRVAAMQSERDSLSSQLSDTYEELTLIYQISSGMRVNRSVDDFFLQACTDVIEVMGVRACGYAVADANGSVETAEMFGSLELDPHVVTQLQYDLLCHFRDSAKAVLNNELNASAAFACLVGKVAQIVAVPIQRQERVLGVLFCLDKLESDFTTQDSKLLSSIANETAIYLENSTLFSDARGMMMGLLHALTSAVDAKDTYTCGHSQRVALFGREIAVRAGLADPLLERVYMAGLLHDVGKIGVPEEVLRKPGKLTDDEFDAMKKHVEIGARILKDVRQIGDLIPGVLYHHERYDGKGYPHNLAGQDIPLVARILCVADCFDAMTSNRTYRKALPIEVALMEIRRCAGTQFDPILADAFLSIGAARLRELVGSVTDQMSIQLAA